MRVELDQGRASYTWPGRQKHFAFGNQVKKAIFRLSAVDFGGAHVL